MLNFSFFLFSRITAAEFSTYFYYHHFFSLCIYALRQAERDLQPWIARDDEQSQGMWRVNQRIVTLIVELMRNHDSVEALIILASASDLLLRATDGMLVDGEACTLPQLEVISPWLMVKVIQVKKRKKKLK